MKNSEALLGLGIGVLLAAGTASAQLIDRTQSPNVANAGIALSLTDEIGAGRGDINTPDSSAFIIARDPFRAIRRGRQLFQRKFSLVYGQGPNPGNGSNDVNNNFAIGAGHADSCAACHGRPRGSAGAGGDVVTRPDSRDAPHLFGLGLKEMLADEITSDLRAIRTQALAQAKSGSAVTVALDSKGIHYGSITVQPNGSIDTSKVVGVNADLRVRPFFAHGGTISIREFINGALQNEMGYEGIDPELTTAIRGARMTTPAGMVLDGVLDALEGPPVTATTNQIPTAIVDYMEFYLLNYFKPGTYKQTDVTQHGEKLFDRVGCNSCHMADLQINRDRRVADLETRYDPANGIFNSLFSVATPSFTAVDDRKGLPTLKQPNYKPFLVHNIFTDFKRHDLGPNFYERNYDGTMQTLFMTTPLWGVGTTAPYGHDGRSSNLMEVILRHGGEAQKVRDAFDGLDDKQKEAIISFLNTLVLFPPDDTASNLDPGDRTAAGFPQNGHGSIKLTVLFNNPGIVE